VVATRKKPILIVGAGPTGLVMALWLKKSGVPFRIIDKNSKPGETSRALAVQARTLEFYRQLGIADDLIQQGVIAKQLILRRAGKVAAIAKFGALGKDISHFAYLLFCSQDIHETFLCAVLKKMGVEIERETELLEFTEASDSVVAKIKTREKEEVVQAEYLCGCDGAHSVVRHGIKAEFAGGSYSQIFFVADVIATGEVADGGLQVSLSTKDFCIVMPIKSKGTIRLTGIVPPESENKKEITYEDVAQSVQKNTGLSVKSVNWFSSYRVHHRVAEKFQTERVFLAGDAGHIHSPAGGQGMNTGIGDAVNLAWKLAEVFKDRAHSSVLKSYEIERQAFAHVLIKSTDQAFKIIASRSWIGSLFRAYVLPQFFAFLTKFKFILTFMFRTVSQTRIQYHSSFLSEGTAGKIRAGDRLPWVHANADDNHSYLSSLEWQIHVYGSLDQSFKVELTDFAIHQMPFSQEMKRKGFLENAAYLIRPDGYVALAIPSQNSAAVKNYFNKVQNGFKSGV